MSKPNDSLPSSNSLRSIQTHTDRSYDQANELRGDTRFVKGFSAEKIEENPNPSSSGGPEMPQIVNPYERETGRKENVVLGSREDSLEEEDEKL